MGDRQARQQRRTDSYDDDRRIVERSGVLALVVGLAAIIAGALAFGDVPFIFGLVIPPAIWSLFACIPWDGAGNPLRWRLFGFLGVINALMMIALGPVLFLVGPAMIMALSGLVLAARIRSLYLCSAGVTLAAAAWIFPWSALRPLPSSMSLVPDAMLLVALLALVGMWCFLTYARSQRPRSPLTLATSAEA